MTEAKGSVTRAILWMLLISILLFWLPVFGPLVAGIVGGEKAGGVGSGFFALASILSGMPVVGVVAGLGGITLALINVGPLLVGAVIGGILSKS